jgi:hypothetical protein
MVREHDEHLLPHDPTLGTDRGDRSWEAERMPCCPRVPFGSKEGNKVLRVCRTGAAQLVSWETTYPLTSASLI